MATRKKASKNKSSSRKKISSKKKASPKKKVSSKRKASSTKIESTKKTNKARKKSGGRKSSKKKTINRSNAKIKAGSLVSTATYKGSSIEVVSENTGQSVYVNRNELDVTRDADTGTYTCSSIPYVYFDSLEKVAQAVIDLTDED